MRSKTRKACGDQIVGPQTRSYFYLTIRHPPAEESEVPSVLGTLLFIGYHMTEVASLMPATTSPRTLGWPMSPRSQTPTYQREGEVQRGAVISPQTYSSTKCPSSAQIGPPSLLRACAPGDRGQGSGSSFPRKAPVPSKWRGPAPHTGPRQELGPGSR